MKKVGGVAVGATFPAGTTYGRVVNTERVFEGVSYDPLTHEFQSVAEGKIETFENGIRGELSVGGFDVPLTGKDGSDPLEAASNHGHKNQYSLIDEREAYRENGVPIQLKFTDYGHGIAGMVSRPSRVSGRLAFTLGDVAENATWETIRAGLTGGGDGKPGVPNKGIPKQGIPAPRAPPESGVSLDG